MDLEKLKNKALEFSMTDKVIEQREFDRLSFIEKFPYDNLNEIKIDQYVQGTDENSFCYWLEFKKIGFSVGGGNASKFGIYRTKKDDKLVYVIGNRKNKKFLDKNEAQEFYDSLLSKILKVIEFAKNDNIEEIKELEIPMYNMIIQKILSIYFPDKFLTIGSYKLLLKCAETLGVENIELSASNLIQINYTCKKIISNLPEFENWSHVKIGTFVWEYFDGEKIKSSKKFSKQYWLYAPGESANMWEEFYQDGIIGLGWDAIGDLSQYSTKEDIKEALTEAYGGTGSKKNNVSTNFDFHKKMNVGDTIIVKRGRGELLGYGIVKSDYTYDIKRPNFHKTRKVEWKLKGKWKVDFNLVLKTLTNITKLPTENPKYDTYYNNLLGIMGVKNDKTKDPKSYKTAFTGWLLDKFGEKTGTPSSYIKAIDALSEILSKELFKTDDDKYLETLYLDLREEQVNENGKYSYPPAKSYGKNGFFSASIKSYRQFLKSITNDKKKSIPQIDFDFKHFGKASRESGLVYSESVLTRFISSLVTKPFVLLTGLSGSGKTKLAQSFAQWMCRSKNQYAIVPVGADWTNREPLLGYPNSLDKSEYVKPETGVLDLILDAKARLELPHFLILDEMNLSHVERYFADFLSVMESKESLRLHDDNTTEKSNVPYEIQWPNNLFLVGTVNIDETTYMFSPKVLDRANVIEFRINEKEIEDFLKNAQEVTSLNGEGANMAVNFVELSNSKSPANSKDLNNELIKFFSELRKVGAEFGYRTALEIQILFSQIDRVNPEYSDKTNEKIDIAIMQKLLPKLHGSRRKLSKVVIALGQLCYEGDAVKEVFDMKYLVFPTVPNGNFKYPISLEKLYRMHRSLLENGFASYAEA